MAEECGICAYKYGLIKRQKITCSNCSFEACFECYKTNSSGVQLKCVSCNKLKDIEDIKKEIGDHRPNINSVFTTLAIKTLDNVDKDQIYDIYNNLEEKEEEEIRIHKEYLETMRKEYNILSAQLREISIIIYDIQGARENSRQKYEKKREEIRGNSSNISSKNIYLNCPDKACKGFVLYETGVCNLCEKLLCNECYSIKNHEHKCKEEDLATVKLIKKGSKECPGCKKFIQKISGCDQMYCLPLKDGSGCGTVFSYNSGKKITSGTIHNPHYTEYRRNILQKINLDGLDIFNLTTIEDYRWTFADRSNFYVFTDMWKKRNKIIENYENYDKGNLEDVFLICLDYRTNKNNNSIQKLKKTLIKSERFKLCKSFIKILIEEIEKNIITLLRESNNKKLTQKKTKMLLEQSREKIHEYNESILNMGAFSATNSYLIKNF